MSSKPHLWISSKSIGSTKQTNQETSRCIYCPINLVPHSLSGTRWQHTKVHPSAGEGAWLWAQLGQDDQMAPDSCFPAITAWKGGAGGEPVLGTVMLGDCASPLCCLLSTRQKCNCNKELAHAYLQLKPKRLLLEITSIWLLSNTGCKWDGFPECHVFTWWHIQNF